MDPQIETINQAIIASYPEIEKLDGISSIVKGYVQSGKTRFELCMVWRCIHILKTPTVLVLSNSTTSYLQVQTRDIQEFNSWISDVLANKHPCLLNVMSKQALRKEIPYFLGCSSSKTVASHEFFMALSNPSQLKKLHQIIVNNNLKNISLIVDEADCSVKDVELLQTTTKTGKLFDSIVEKSGMLCQVTATPFANLNKKCEKQTSCYLLPRPENYRGIGEVKWWPSDANLRLARNVDSLIDLVVDSVQHCDRCPSGYRSILVNASHSQKQQKLQARLIKTALPDFKVYVINTDETNEIKEINPNGFYQRLNTCSICDLYRLFEREKYDNVIVSCYKASRANSYRPIRQHGSGGLTGMIYLPTKTSHCAQLIQSMRIFGVYDPDYPTINLWTTPDAYWRITREIVNVDVLSREASNIPQNTREMLGEIQLYNVGKHDRKYIDDTTLINQHDLISREYDSFEEARDYILGDLKYQNSCPATRCLNSSPEFIHLPSDLAHDEQKRFISLKKKEIQDFIRTTLREKYQLDKNIRIRFAHNWNYYHRLFDLHFRYKNEVSDFVVGFPECGGDIPYVKWNPEYCDPKMNQDFLDLSTQQIYWYWTSLGKVRVYCKNLRGVKIGTLSHKKYA